MLFLLFLGLHQLTALGKIHTVPQPAPTSWQSYSTSSNVLQVQWPSSPGTFQVTYTIGGVPVTMPSVSSTSASIPCAATDGSTIDVSYTTTVGSDTSIPSPTVTFMCAGLPLDTSAPTLAQVLTQVTLSWTVPSQQGIGTPILLFNVYQYQTTWTKLAQVSPTTVSYIDTVQYGLTYQYKVSVQNWVGESTSPVAVSVTPTRQMDATQSTVTYPASVYSEEPYLIKLVAKDSAGSQLTSPTELVFFLIQDYCIVPTGQYECIRVSSTNPLYYLDFIGPAGVYLQMQNNNDGTYSGQYTPHLQGPYSMSVQVYRPGGLWDETWDNIWFSGVPDTTNVISTLQQSWTAVQLISTYAGDFVSMKMSGLLLSPVSERVSFFVYADDGIRLFWEGVVAIDLWDVCCTEMEFSVNLTQGTYYPMKIEWKQLQGQANFTVTWESYSLPLQVIPSQYLFYPQYVQGSPWTVTVLEGLSTALLCYATGFDTAVAGVAKTISLYSVDARGNLLNNPTDAYSLVFTLGTVQLSFSSTYVSNGLSYSTVILTKAGIYSVAVSLYEISIKGSPYQINVTPGTVSSITSTSGLSIFASANSPLTCGLTYSVSFTTVDSFLNPVTSGLVDIQITFLDLGNYVSAIGVTPPTNWVAIYGKNYQGSVTTAGLIQFVIYRAGDYTATTQLNGVALAEGSVSLAVKPSAVFGPRCVAVVTTNTATAGVVYTFQVQMRDEYYNISVDKLAALTSETCTATMGVIVVTGIITDAQPGVLLVSTQFATVGTYTLAVSLNSAPIQNSGFSVTVLWAPISTTTSVLSTALSSYQAGSVVKLTITSRDAYSNVRVTSTDTFSVQIVGQNTNTSIATVVSANGDGTYAVSFQVEIVDTYTISCLTNAVAITGSGQTFQVSPGLVAAANTSVTLATNYVVGKGTIQISSFDAFGNPISTPVNSALMGHAQYKAFFYGPMTTEITSSFTSFTTYMINMSPITVAGTYSLVLGLEQQGGLLGFYYSAQDFTGLVASLSYHNAAGILPQSYTSLDPVISFNWGSSVPATLKGSNYFSIVWVGQVLALYTETLTLYVTADDLVRLTWTGTVLLDTITPGTMIFQQQVTVAVLKNSLYDIKIEYVELTGNASIKLEWGSNSITRQVIPSSNLFSLLNSNSSPMSVTFVSDVTNPALFSIAEGTSDPFPLYEAGAGNAKTILLTTYDAYGNQQSQPETVSANFVTVNNVVNVVQVQPGLHSLTFLLTIMGTYQLTIFTSVNSVQRLITVYSVTVMTGMGNGLKSIITGVTNTVAGVLGSFTLVAYDYFGNPRTAGGDVIQLAISNEVTNLPASVGTVTDNKDGTYLISYLITKAGSYTATITMNGDAVNLITQVFTIVSGTPSSAASVMTVPATVTLDTLLDVSAQINDVYGNPVAVPVTLYGYVAKESNPNFVPLQIVFTAQNVATGSYTGSVMYNATVADSSGVCTSSSSSAACIFTGSLLVYTSIMYSGVQGAYYSTSSMTGTPTLTRVDSTVGVDWANSPITGFTSNSLSIQWSGFLQSQAAGTYAFGLTAVDSAVLWVSGSILVNTTTGKTTGSLVLGSGLFYAITVDFFCASLSALLSFVWTAPAQTSSSVVPSTSLFYPDPTFVQGNPVPVTGTT